MKGIEQRITVKLCSNQTKFTTNQRIQSVKLTHFIVSILPDTESQNLIAWLDVQTNIYTVFTQLHLHMD